MLSPNLIRNSNISLYEQLYEYIKDEIRDKKLIGQLPSKRNLAEHLGISVNTVTRSYDNLIDEGYIYSKERKGYFTSDIDNLAVLSKIPMEIIKTEEKSYKYSLDSNSVDLDNFPIYTWRKMVNSTLNYADNSWLNLESFLGLEELRREIARYLRGSRGVKTSYENVVIGSGVNYLMQMLTNILDEDLTVAIENPGYKSLADQLGVIGVKQIPINLDDKGIDIKQLEKSSADMVIVSPSHQFPTGTIMAISRRTELLNWAKDEKYIIEDDYDSEFKYYGSPIPALKSLDVADRVIYLGNFSKSIYPALRISYMVLPNDLLNRLLEFKERFSCPVDNMSQLSLSKFMNEGYFERHLNRMRKLYADKREIAVNFFKNRKGYKVIDSQAGLHFTLEVDLNLTEAELIKRAADEKIKIFGLKEFYSQEINYKKPKILIGYGGIAIDKLEDVLKKLANVWED